MQQAQSEFPILNKLGLLYKESPGRAQGFLEFWPGEETGTPMYPRPQDFPMGKAGVEVFDPNTRPIDIMGDVASHHLIQSDPVVKQHYQQFQQSMTPDQTRRLQKQYQHAQENEGEKRPFEQWKERTGLPGYFRGYAFKQWDKPEDMYTPAQMKKFDEMMQYLRQK